MMNDTIISPRQVDALRKLVEYSIADERRSLEEHISDEHEAPDNLDSMSDKELFEYCETNGIEHIWVEIYHLSKI